MSAISSAQPAAESASVAETSQYLTFLLGGEMYALGILGIKEIIEFGNLTVVPMMPASVRGVINLRGAVVPVLDLNVRFGREPTQVARRTCIVIVEFDGDNGHQVMGLMVDAVSAVLEIGADAIEPPPAFGARIRREFIRGIGKVDKRFVIVLDVGRVVSDVELEGLDALPIAAAEPAHAAG